MLVYFKYLYLWPQAGDVTGRALAEAAAAAPDVTEQGRALQLVAHDVIREPDRPAAEGFA